ncbi:helix-turn-helix domain-containing protein [Pandoraea fibrosis]|uniref:helix-turn-helix domain-containing protein n=1 Tax=Pandoraea fibrosis TaxID=1891094 RepID=UPI00351F9428
MFTRYTQRPMSKRRSSNTDWKRPMIVAHVHMSGTSFRELSRRFGVRETVASQALYRPYPKWERIIAAQIGVPPEVIWPTRYARREQRRIAANRRKARRMSPISYSDDSKQCSHDSTKSATGGV